MTKEEAIKRIAESYTEAKADFEENEDCYSDKTFIDGVYQGVTSACFYIKQIDEQKWHPYPQERPTKDGKYFVWDSRHEGILLDYWDGNQWDYDYLLNIVAWQNVEPYEEGQK